ncbi:MAG: hypothetical protein JXB26_05940 [Candidatus Aminicenantes bacterium]|nr:hypothetical protein [Candidatus Aminicenantes bacterium]
MKQKIRVALVGTDSLQGKELKTALDRPGTIFSSVDFFDTDVDEEYSKLTQFRGEPAVIHPLASGSLLGANLAFLASGADVNRNFGVNVLKKQNCRAIDLSGVFNQDPEIPLIVNGINDDILAQKRPRLVANPHPVTIMLSHFYHTLLKSFNIKKFIGFVLQPVSVFGEEGIHELAEQSVALLNGRAFPRKVFKEQVAFNLLFNEEQPDSNGFSPVELQIINEMRNILDRPDLPLCLSVVQAPVFHTYSVMVHLETDQDIEKKGIEKIFKSSALFKWNPSGWAATPASVAGKNEIHIGRIKIEQKRPGCVWMWLVADNLTSGSVVNALEVAEKMLALEMD